MVDISALPPRFREKIVRTPEGCWRWTGAVNKLWGYGNVRFKGKSCRAHRVVFEIVNGFVPPELDHVCHDPRSCAGGPTCLHRRCVNPDHLRSVTRRENLRNSNNFTAAQMSQTTCKRGHEYDRVRESDGRRICYACKRQRRVESLATNGFRCQCGNRKDYYSKLCRVCRPLVEARLAA